MLIQGISLYEKNHLYRINTPADPLYYFFDYDERSYKLNMQFQHFHSFYEIMIPLEESAGHLINGKYYELKMHDLVLLRPSLLHKTVYPKGYPSKRLIINFRFSSNMYYGMGSVFAKITALFNEKIPIFRFEETQKQALFKILNEIFLLSDSSRESKNLLIHNKFLEFLVLLSEEQDQDCYLPENAGQTIEDKIYSITAYIHSHYQEELSLEFISQKFFISTYYLSRSFKAVTGFTLINYIQMTRIRNAQLLLLSTSEKITDIAEQCGFTSFSQFNRCFNKFCQLSPSAYRAANTVNGLETFELQEDLLRES